MALFQNSVLQKHTPVPLASLVEIPNPILKSFITDNGRAKERLSPVTSSGVEMPLLTKKDEFEWMELFEENKKNAQELQREIEKIDAEIDRMVYELYGLTEEEIGIVENS